ncbi:MAG TPA: Crp/Fnr family transcriptional regulator [Chitinophagaceae bacterium]|nr:Crp/Fnr family transcriptional regulator [Chitinophagaceae bacterium]
MPEWIEAVAVHRTNIYCKKGEVILSEGDEVKGIYFLYSGKVKVHKHWDKDKELIVRFAKPGDIVGHRGFGKTNIYPISATALENSTLCFIEVDFFKSSLKVNVNFMYDLMMFYAEELQESEKRMRNLAHMPVKGRIAHTLLYLREKFGVTRDGYIDITISRQDIASFAGTAYETAFRAISELGEEGLLLLTGKNILLKDITALEKIISDVP